MLWQDVLEEDLIDQLGGAGLGLVLLQLLLPGVVQEVDVLVLSVKQPEIEEESEQENKMREIALISLCGPYLVSKTLTLSRKIIRMIIKLI